MNPLRNGFRSGILFNPAHGDWWHQFRLFGRTDGVVRGKRPDRKRLPSSRKFLWAFAIVVILPACTQQTPIPVKQFTAYRQAFDVAKLAASDVLGDYAEIAKQAKREIAAVRSTLNQGQSYDKLPPLFKPSTVENNPNLDDDIAVRLKALQTVARYNDALLNLVEGKSVQELGDSVKSLAGNISSLAQGLGASIPGVGLAVPIITKFLAMAETARNRKDFARALHAGRPVINKIFDFLISDTIVYDQLRRNLAQRKIDHITDDALSLVTDMAKLTRGYAEPLLLSDLSRAKSNVAKEMQNVLRSLGENPSALPYKDLPGSLGGLPYTPIVQSQLELFLKELRAAGTERKKIITGVIDYQRTLDSYVKLLRQVGAALDAVQVNLNAPFDLTVAVNDLVGLAFEVRGAIASLSTP